MFDYITGNVVAAAGGRLVLDCGGVGFLLSASNNACAAYSDKKQAKVPVYLAVREDAIELYGFADEKERGLFLKLITVSGVGAKLAVAILGGFPTDVLMSAIAGGDAALLSTIKGVGKKTAERIVLELKGKVEADGVATAAAVPQSAVDQNAVSALMGLGYDRKEAESAVARFATPQMTTEEIVRAVLRG